jgi:hypothetical protein
MKVWVTLEIEIGGQQNILDSSLVASWSWPTLLKQMYRPRPLTVDKTGRIKALKVYGEDGFETEIGVEVREE